MTRDERQALGVQKWVDNRLKGTLVYGTGVGKTRSGCLAIARFQKGNPKQRVLVVVPSDPVKLQWLEELAKFNIRADVITLNMASKGKYECGLLVIDEYHKVGANHALAIFDNIKYKAILGLTATFERCDGRDKILAKHAPIVDTISIKEAVSNGWLSKHIEYKVLIDIPDIDEYIKLNQQFQEHFSFFDFDFSLAMACATDYKARFMEAKRRGGDEWKEVNKQLIIHGAAFSRLLQARKKFIANHPKKLEIATKILQHRTDKKCLTFSSTIATAELLAKVSGMGKVYSGKDSAKQGRLTLEEFKSMKSGVIHSISKLDTGFNDPTIQVGIVLGFNSSKTIATQRAGRIIRANNPNEEKEIFTLVLKGTQDEKWAQNSLSGRDFIVIDEDGLNNLLDGKDFNQKVDRPTHIMFNA